MDIKKTKEIEELKKEKKELVEKYSDILVEKRNKSINKAIDDFELFFKEEEFELKSDDEFIHNAIYGDSAIKLSIHDPKKPLIGCQARMDLLVDLTEYEKRKYIIPINFKGERPSINVKISLEENKEGIEEKKNNIKEKIEELKEKISNKDDLEFYYGLVETVKGTKNSLLSEYPQHESFKRLLEEIFN